MNSRYSSECLRLCALRFADLVTRFRHAGNRAWREPAHRDEAMAEPMSALVQGVKAAREGIVLQDVSAARIHAWGGAAWGPASVVRWLALVLLAHPASHQALQTHSDLLSDTAFRWRSAELAGETEVVPFGPGLD